MERGAPEYSQSGLPTPYPSNVGDTPAEPSSNTVEHPSTAPYPGQQEVRSSSYSASATPTSEYSVYPPSSRSASFAEPLQRPYHAASSTPSSGTMAQTTPSPFSPLLTETNHQSQQQVKSDTQLSLDPAIAATSPTYAHPPQYSPYAPPPPPQDLPHGYQHPGSLYAQPRPDWAGYGQHSPSPITPGHHVFPQTPTTAAPPARPNQVGLGVSPASPSDPRRPQTVERWQSAQAHAGLSSNRSPKPALTCTYSPSSRLPFPTGVLTTGPHQVYSFVPIPGAQQHKRPRRRYEEIERMYKCGWNGCEKAYGTLNHLNAHVTMQGHGPKRTPEGEQSTLLLDSHLSVQGLLC